MSKRIVTLLMLSVVSTTSFATTPSDVHKKVMGVIGQIEALKDHLGVQSTARTPGIQIGKTPLHAYAKGLELLEKIRRYQVQHDYAPLPLPQLPSELVKPANVLQIIQVAENAIGQINRKLDVPAVKGVGEVSAIAKTPSDVYEKIWRASFLMDTLVAPIKPANVLRNVSMIEMGLTQIAQRLDKDMILPAAQDYQSKKPVDVNIQLYRLLYKLARLERSMQLKPLIVPAFPAGKIKPEDAYDATGNVLADLTRIAVKLKIPAVKRLPLPLGKVSPNDVYAQVSRLNSGLQQLLD